MPKDIDERIFSNNCSEEILIRRGIKPVNGTPSDSEIKKPCISVVPTQSTHAVPVSLSKTKCVHSLVNFPETNSHNKRSKGRGSLLAGGSNQKQGKLSVALKANPYAPAPLEVLQELKRLQQPMIIKAHQDPLKNAGNYTASPELLVYVRDGPGTDQKSEIFHDIERLRQIPATNSIVESTQGINVASPELSWESIQEQHNVQFKAYIESACAYPRVDHEELVISSTPASGQEYKRIPSVTLWEQQRQAGPKHAAETWWASPETHVLHIAFCTILRDWLDTAAADTYTADVFHTSYFDGTAHSDGIGSFYICRFDHGVTVLNPEDGEARLHHHETVAGYTYNFAIHIKKQEVEEDARKRRARSAYIESMMRAAAALSGWFPVYLRPVNLGDTLDLAGLMNWYMKTSPLSTDDSTISKSDVHQRIQICKKQQLPFIVAVERQNQHGSETTSVPENVLGYALANDFIGKKSSSRYTATLQLFVRHDVKRNGIGRYLMDKLLEVCDAKFKPSQAYRFESCTKGDVKYSPGGSRLLSHLIFAISYPGSDRADYEWIMNWLKRYGFEEQCLLKDVGVKFQKRLDICYLVRRTAFTQGGVFRESDDLVV